MAGIQVDAEVKDREKFWLAEAKSTAKDAAFRVLLQGASIQDRVSLKEAND